MKKMFLLSILSVLFVSMNVSATPKPEPKTETQVQTTVLRGLVNDILTNETLAGATITANGQKVYSDLDGNFVISNICNGKCELKINMISYKDQLLEIDTNSNSIVKVKMQQR
ncbi:MAG: carboxypeptidase-like regulatory domain-containing protein [Paludibacter sp.]